MPDPKTLEFKLLDTLKLFKERIIVEREDRMKKKENCLTFGMKYLDECLGGIYKEDLIVYGAKTNKGKTQLATITAMANAKAGKRVHFFALEGAMYEIERRIKFQILSEMFYKTNLHKEYQTVSLNFMDWYYGHIDQFQKVESELDELLRDMFPNLETSYPCENDFTPEDFEREFLRIQNKTDLIILDHLHYFDFEDDNENRAMKQLIKKIKRLAFYGNVPVILISHIRKEDRRFKTLVPSIDDFHGSSDITKIATKVVMIAPAKRNKDEAHNCWPTYVQALKCRVDSSRTRYVGLVVFDNEMHRYNQRYQVGQLNLNEDEFEGCETIQTQPKWAKSADLWVNPNPKKDSRDDE